MLLHRHCHVIYTSSVADTVVNHATLTRHLLLALRVRCVTPAAPSADMYNPYKQDTPMKGDGDFVSKPDEDWTERLSAGNDFPVRYIGSIQVRLLPSVTSVPACTW